MSKPEVEASVGISITNACYECQLLDSVCPECEDNRTAKDAEIAHELVDDRNIIYPNQWHNRDLTQQDWVSSQSIVGYAHRLAKIIEIPVTRYKESEPYQSTEPKVVWEEPDSDFLFRSEYAPPITNILDRLGSYWFLGNHIYPLIKEEDLKATIALRKNEAICPNCHLSYNALVGCNN